MSSIIDPPKLEGSNCDGYYYKNVSSRGRDSAPAQQKVEIWTSESVDYRADTAILLDESSVWQ